MLAGWPACWLAADRLVDIVWLQTNGVNTNGAAAGKYLIIFDRLGKKVRPVAFGNIKVGYREYPKSPSVKKNTICSDPISVDPNRPFPSNPDPGRARALGAQVGTATWHRQHLGEAAPLAPARPGATAAGSRTSICMLVKSEQSSSVVTRGVSCEIFHLC